MLTTLKGRHRLRHHLFCYGTLQIPDVIQAVIGRRFKGRRAEISGYGAFRVRRAEYPGLRPITHLKTRGRVYFDLTPAELSILDRFEGRLYHRRRLTVRFRDGRRRGVWVYVVKPARQRRLAPTLWDRRDFRRRRYTRFMQRFVRDRRTVFDPGDSDTTEGFTE